MPDQTNMVKLGINVTITRSHGRDGAPVVFVDTDESITDGPRGPEIRILLNDEPVFTGKEYEPRQTHDA